MNSLKNYFSPTKLEPLPVLKTQKLKELIDQDDLKPKNASSKSSSRRIISNMESVINSVKKKHRHRRKKKDLPKKSETEITDISNILCNSLSFISPDVTVEEVNDQSSSLKENNENVKKAKRGRPRKTAQSSAKLRNESTPLLSQASTSTVDSAVILSPVKNGSIRDHFLSQTKVQSKVSSSEQSETEKANPKMDAFALMMNARNRSIGSNTLGKENPIVEVTASLDPEKVKRKLLLQEWAEQKGGRKRKIEEVQREEYIENQLEKRAKRFKKMLVGDNNPPSKPVKKKVRQRKVLPQVSSETQEPDPDSASSSKQFIDEKIKSSVPRKKLGRPRKHKQLEERATLTDAIVLDSEPSPKLNGTLKISRKRVRRISSDESIQISPDNQDSDFVEKLSSPIKKRDSLLGYFQKVVTPVAEVLIVNESPINTTPSSRPRRSCAGKARYDYDLEPSPTHSESKSRAKLQKSVEEDTNDSDELVEVIRLDASIDDDIENKQKKLAPLFMKSIPKPVIAPEILQAKKDFLMSGIPDKMKMEISKQRQYEEAYEISLESLFPTISHVGCDESVGVDISCRDVDWKKCGIVWRSIDEIDIKVAKYGTTTTACLNPITPAKKSLPALKKLKDLEDKVEIVKSLKTFYDKFPTYRCFKQLREKYGQCKAIGVEQVSDSVLIMNTSQNGSLLDGEGDQSGNGELLFTEKYKPMNLNQVLVNFHPANELKDFLSSWQNGYGSKLNNSMSDFDCSNDSNNAGYCNSVVLHGPSSSGKTNAVFALANEMNFNVLEINAGMKRTGKKLLLELQEATQSHQVSKDKGNLLKRTFSGLKGKISDLSDTSSSDLCASSKLSLILVEDADIVFEQDSGFVEAIHQLVATSKRPVIIISNKSECQHLLRLQKQSSIEFPMPNVLNISKFLSVLSLVENCPIDLDDIISLYLYNRRNLRKTLLELQFFIQSGGDRCRFNGSKLTNMLSPVRKFSVEENDSIEKNPAIDDKEKRTNKKAPKVYTHQTLFEFYTVNQNTTFLFQYPVDFDYLYFNLKEIFALPKINESMPARDRNSKNPQRSNMNSADLGEMVQFYDNISAACYLASPQVEDRLNENLNETIAHTLTEQAVRINLNVTGKVNNVPRNILERKVLSYYLPTNYFRTYRSIDLDYEPTLRTICRSERSRSSLERRGSRFYHYLRNLCTSTSSFSTHEFDKTCSVFVSTADDNGDEQEND